MGEQTKRTVKQAKEFFKKVEEGAKEFQRSIPDKTLVEKLKKIQEGAVEIVKHIEEKGESK